MATKMEHPVRIIFTTRSYIITPRLGDPYLSLVWQKAAGKRQKVRTELMYICSLTITQRRGVTYNNLIH